MVCAAKGYKCCIIMPQLPPMMERYIICRKFGAEVHLTAGAPGGPMVENMFSHLTDLLNKNKDYWSPLQFENPDNPGCHVESTGPEIWDQTDGEVDFFIAGAGTGGTMAGVGPYLKSKKPSVINVCVEPTESRVLTGAASDKHTIVGIGAGIPLKFIENMEPGAEWRDAQRGAIDRFASATSEESTAWANRLAAEEGLLVGPSTGAACKVAVQIACSAEAAGKTIVVVFPSSGIRYITHPMWAAVKAEAASILAPPPDFSNAPPLLRWRSEDYVPPQQ
jgi:cysteine synthase A